MTLTFDKKMELHFYTKFYWK